MKTKKLLSLILLGMLCSIGSVWGDPTPALPSTTLDLSTISAGDDGAYNSGSDDYYVFSPYQIYYSDKPSWATANNSGSTDGSVGSAITPFPKSNVFTSFKAATIKYNASKGPYAYRVKKCVEASALVKSENTKRTCTIEAFEVSGGVVATEASKTQSTTTNSQTVIKITGLDSSKEYYIRVSQSASSSSGNSTYFMVGFKSVPHSLVVKTQPQDAVYAQDEDAEALTVAAAFGNYSYSYQWYSCDDALKTNPVSLGSGSGAQTASYTPSTSATGYYFCRITDTSTPTPGSVDSNVATITISAAEAPSNPEITSASSVVRYGSLTMTASADGLPTPTYQWYSNTTDNAVVDNTHKIDGATSETYSPSTETMGTKYYYFVATNSEGSITSATQAITVTGRTNCELINIKFSNGAYGAIATLSKGEATVTVPYLSGEVAPSINESSIEISDGATKVIAGNTITITAEDGTTTGTYTIAKTAFTPLAVTADIAATTFTAVPTWISNPYSYDSSKGLKFAKNVNNDGTRRVSLGNTRQYYFIGAANSLTLAAKGTVRKVNVYLNGTKVISDTNNDALGAIALDPSAPCMVMIESNQTGGDGGFESYAIEAATNAAATITGAGWATFCSTHALNFAGEISGLEAAYIVTGGADGVLSKTKVTGTVAAGTGLLLKGSEGTVSIPIVASGTDYSSTNQLIGVTVKTQIDANTGWVLMNDATNGLGFYKNTKAFTLGAKTAYLPVGFTGGVDAPSHFRLIDEENNATNIQNVEVNDKTIKFIENGQLFILKEGVVYDTMGRVIR